MTGSERIVGVLIVGGGYAGLHAARGAAAEGIPVTIVDPAGVHGFTTRLAAVAGGTAPPGDAFAPLDTFGHANRIGRVVGLGDGVVELGDGTTLIADAVVVTAGARPTSPDLPGIDLAASLRTPADAIRLRRRIDGADSLLVVGGGATGMQLAGAVSVTRPELQVRVIDRDDRVLAGLGQALSARASEILERRGVELDLGRGVERVLPDGLVLADGSTIGGLVVWAGGFDSVVDDLGDDLPTDEGRLQIDDELRIAGWRQTFAAGDVALHRNGDGEAVPMAAQIAVQAGAAAGRNAARSIAGRSLARPTLSHRGWVIDLGGGWGVAQIGPIPLAVDGLDRLAPLLHLVIDLKHLLEVGGVGGLAFAPGRHRPDEATIERLLSTGSPGQAADQLSAPDDPHLEGVANG